MFNSIIGTVTGKNSRQLFIEANGIEWDICMPDSNIDMLPETGKEVRVFTWLHHTESLMNLYGFASPEERLLFLDLLRVDGVGPKAAVRIMSGVDSKRLFEILESGDVEILEKIPGVGKKTAGKMMLALKGKLSLSDDYKSSPSSPSSPYDDAVASLVSMGYDKNLAKAKIMELAEKLSSEPDFVKKSQKDREDHLFRLAIVELS